MQQDAINTRTLFRLGAAAASRQVGIVLPLVVVETAVALLGLVPLLFVIAHVFSRAGRIGAAEPGLALFLGTIESLLDPGLWAVAITGVVLVAAGGWLVRTLALAGAIGALQAQVGRRERVEGDGFARGILEGPERWLLAGVVAGLLRMLAFACGLGAVIAAMTYFVREPGAVAALVMTVATVMLVAVPFLAAALEVGFVRAVMRPDPPMTSLGEGMWLALRHAAAVMPVWYGLVLANLGLGVAGLVASGGLAALPSSGGLWILNLAPRGLVWLTFAALLAMLTLIRLGAYTALVAWDDGALPSIRKAPAERAMAPPPLPPDEPPPIPAGAPG